MSKPQTDSVPALHPAGCGDDSEATLTVFNGRPTIYTPQLIDKTLQYLQDCPDLVPSLAGLALCIGVRKKRLENWKSLDVENLDPEKYPRFEEFRGLLEALNELQERQALNKGASGEWNSNIAKLVLSQHGYREKVEATHELGKSLVDIYARMLDSEPENDVLDGPKHVDSEEISTKALIESKEGL